MTKRKTPAKRSKKRTPKRAVKKKAPPHTEEVPNQTHKVEMEFHQEDFVTLKQVSRDLGCSIAQFIHDAIDRRLRDVHDFRAIKNRCLHFAAGDDRVCVLCGDTLQD